MLDENKYLVLGKIKSPVGLKGEVRLQLKASAAEELKHMTSCYVGEELLTVEYVRTGLRPDGMIVKFADIDDRDQAFRLQGQVCYDRWDRAAKLPEGQFYIHDIIGMKCMDENEAFVGSVVSVLMGKQQLYEIAKNKTAEEVAEIRSLSKAKAKENDLHMEEFRRSLEKNGSPNPEKAMKEERKKLDRGPVYETFLVPIVDEYIVKTDPEAKTIHLKNIQELMNL